MKTTYIIDASGFLFRSYYALPPMNDKKGRSTQALFGFARSLFKLIKDFSPNTIVAVFEGKDNKQKRVALYPDYKANRSSPPEDLPEQIHYAKLLCHQMGIPVFEKEGFEADDLIGSLVNDLQNSSTSIYVCTSDKDLCQLVNEKTFMLNVHDNNRILNIEKVHEKFGVYPQQIPDYLALIGDSSDNIPGVPGIGPKTAAQLLSSFETLDNILENISHIKGQKKQEAFYQHLELLKITRQLVQLNKISLDLDSNSLTFIPKDKKTLIEFFQDFNLLSLVKEIDSLEMEHLQQDIPLIKKEIPLNISIYDEETTWNSLFKELRSLTTISLTTISTFRNPMESSLEGIAFSLKGDSYAYIPFNKSTNKDLFSRYLSELFSLPNIHFFTHNGKETLHIFANESLPLPRFEFDTILGSYLTASHNKDHSLKQLAEHYFQESLNLLEDLQGNGKKKILIKDIPTKDLALLASQHACLIKRLTPLLKKDLEDKNLFSLFQDIEMPISHILFSMEREGIFANKDLLETMSQTIHSQLNSLSKEILNYAGEEFLINSPKQLSYILYEKLQIPPPKKTTTGFSTDAETLDFLKNIHPIIPLILEYRQLEKLRSTYIDSLPESIHPRTHKIHCTFMQHVAATGRLSCHNPNLQTIPIRTKEGKAIRKVFEPKDGCVFLSADYSQIELRLLAHFSKDPNLVQSFLNHDDVHRQTAAKVFDIMPESVTDAQRYQAKAVNFGILYGQQAFGLSKELGISIDEANRFIKSYFEQYPLVQEFIHNSIEKVKQDKVATTLLNRQRLIHEIDSKNGMIRQAAYRLAVNTPIQGSAADIIKLAMIKINQKLNDNCMLSRMILQIHDELILEVPKNEIEDLKSIVIKEMEQVIQLNVPLVVNISIGKNWEEC